MNLYKHQKDIIDKDPKKAGLFLGTGSGKTRIAISLAWGSTLVICPKTQKEDQNWEREASRMNAELADTDTRVFGIGLTVISKETFRRDHAKLPPFDTVICDECHTLLGVTPNIRFRKKVAIPKSSQLFEALYSYLEKNKPTRLYLLSATILRSPMTVWAANLLLNEIK